MSDAYALTPRVFIVRHGETDWAKLGRFTGVTERELTGRGRDQVRSTTSTLVGSRKLLDPERLTHVYVSPRKRAVQTFEILLPSSFSKGSEKVSYTEDIAEWNYGSYEGMKNLDIREKRKNNGLDTERAWDIWTDGCEEGESPQQVAERLDRLIAEIKTIQRPCMHGEKFADVLVIAHGHILRAFAKRWVRWTLGQDLPMEIQPGGLAILSYKNNNPDEPALNLGLALP